MYFDSHVHFDGFPAATLEAVLQRAQEAGVARCLAVGASPDANRIALDVAVRFPDCARAAVGYDRDCAGKDCSFEELERLAPDPRVAAIGEIGLDFHYHPEAAAGQAQLMARMLELARRMKLPAVVHSREAEEASFRLLAEHQSDWKGDAVRIGVLHCFTGSAGFARKVLDLGFFISFSGIVTFRNAAAVHEAARLVPDDRLLIETDSPLLAPAPHRGKPNEPAFLPLVAEALARVRNTTAAHIADITARNAATLFGMA